MNILQIATWVASVGGAVITVGIILSAVGKRLIFEPLRHEITQATYPIQPNANGGKSLPDIAKAVNDLKCRHDEMEQRQAVAEAKLDIIVNILSPKP